MEEPFIDGDEEDALTDGKKYYSWRSGERKKIKKKYNKRTRRKERQRLKEELNEYKRKN